MKCPECGSETKIFRGVVICSNNNCSCKHGYFNEQLDKMKHQERLDKVLNKFKNNELTLEEFPNCVYKIIYSKEFGFYQEVTIHVSDLKTFYTGLHTFVSRVISLDTVESLLKDFEKENE